jgi:predicted DNA-binding transcriptional regulator YafY
MTPVAPDAAQRILNLAAYAAESARTHTPITLTSVVDDVPGYESDAPRNDDGDLAPDTKEWEAVRKKLRRDIKDLRDSWGISLDYDETDHSYRLALPFFTAKERRALLAAAATIDVEGLPSTRPGDLGAAIDDSGALVILKLHALVATFRVAISSRNRVGFEYDARTRTVEPYALGMWRNHWYLAGRDASSGHFRRFRLDRIESSAISVDTASTFSIPGDFDPDTAFALDPNEWGTDPLVHARVRVSPDHAQAFVDELGGSVVRLPGTGRDGLGDDTFVELDVRHYDSFRTRLLAFGRNAVVLSPPVLVDAVRAHLVALAGDTG